jgi:hypothetical protein
MQKRNFLLSLPILTIIFSLGVVYATLQKELLNIFVYVILIGILVWIFTTINSWRKGQRDMTLLIFLIINSGITLVTVVVFMASFYN